MLVLTEIGPMCITSVIYVCPASHFQSHILTPRAAPYIPPIDPSNASDTQNSDDIFLDMEPLINYENDVDTDQERQTDLELTDGEDSVATQSQSRSSSIRSVDVFDGYSFKGRHSVIIDDEEEVSEEEEEEEEEENVTVPSIRKSTTTMSSASADFSTKSSQDSRTTPGKPSLKAASIMTSASSFVSALSSRYSRTTLSQPSLKSKESAVSVGSPGSSSGGSTNRANPSRMRMSWVPQADEEHEEYKNKKLKRGAEKVLELFALP